MIAVDTSAVLAIHFGEPEADALITALAAAPRRFVSAMSRLEASVVVLRRQGQDALPIVAELFDALGVEVVPFTDAHRAAAELAYRRFGKGRHPAALNLGDCCAYALARVGGYPLLFKGQDFSATDVPTLAW